MKRIQYILDVTLPEQWAERSGKVKEVPDYVARQLCADGYALLHGDDQPEDDGPVAPPALPQEAPEPPPLTAADMPAVDDLEDTDLDPSDEEST